MCQLLQLTEDWIFVQQNLKNVHLKCRNVQIQDFGSYKKSTIENTNIFLSVDI